MCGHKHGTDSAGMGATLEGAHPHHPANQMVGYDTGSIIKTLQT